jgi:hypothetical protein
VHVCPYLVKKKDSIIIFSDKVSLTAMAHRRDHRPQSEKAVIAFNEAWMAERDINGDNGGVG